MGDLKELWCTCRLNGSDQKIDGRLDKLEYIEETCDYDVRIFTGTNVVDITGVLPRNISVYMHSMPRI